MRLTRSASKKKDEEDVWSKVGLDKESRVPSHQGPATERLATERTPTKSSDAEVGLLDWILEGADDALLRPTPAPSPVANSPSQSPIPEPESTFFEDQLWHKTYFEDTYPEEESFGEEIYPEIEPFFEETYPEVVPLLDEYYPEARPLPKEVLPDNTPYPDKTDPEEKLFVEEIHPVVEPFFEEAYPEAEPLREEVLPEEQLYPDEFLPEEDLHPDKVKLNEALPEEDLRPDVFLPDEAFPEKDLHPDKVYSAEALRSNKLYPGDAPFDMSSPRSRQPRTESLHELDNFNDHSSSLSSSTLTVLTRTPSWPGIDASNNGNQILGNITEIEDEHSQSPNHPVPVTDVDMVDLPSDRLSTSTRVWGPSNRPSSLEFTIYEDPPENSTLSTPTRLASGFHAVEEDKENVLVNPFEYVSSSSSSDGELHPYIEWSEAAHRPRDAFGVPVEYDGPPSTDQTISDTEEVNFRRGRHVLAPLAIPDAEGSDHDDGNVFTQAEPQIFQQDEDDEEEL